VKGFNGDPAVRHKAAAAGGLTGLATHLLTSGVVDFVVHAHPQRYYSIEEYQGAKISSTAEEIMEGRGSRYQPTAVLGNINEILARQQPFAFVGKPCDINALRNLSTLDDRVDVFCKAMLTISCGSYADPDCLDRFLQYHSITVDDIAEFRWRGHGCPGGCPYVKTKDGRELRADYVDFWYGNGSYAGPLTYQWRCKMCPDYFGFQADLVVMDCWPAGTPEHSSAITDGRRHEQEGYVIVMSRTQRGEQILKDAEASHFLRTQPAAVEDVLDTQPHQVRRAAGTLAKRLAHLHQPHVALDAAATATMRQCALVPAHASAAVPPGAVEKGPQPQHTQAPGLQELERAIAHLPDEVQRFNRANWEGTRMRLERGDATEPGIFSPGKL